MTQPNPSTAADPVSPGPTPQRRSRYRTNRLEAFSDGVFAIAITLLVLEISVPEHSEADLLAAVLAQWSSYLGYVVSFSTIGAIWLAHNAITEHLTAVDTTLQRLNLLLLLVVAFIPFPTRLLAEYAEYNEAERVAATVYGATLLLAAVMVSVVWRYARRSGLVEAKIRDDDIRYLTSRLTPGLAGYAVMLLVGLVIPRVAVFGYLVIAVFFLLPIRSARSRTT
jgi:TMEM175 potassium channel family protein